MMLQSFADAVGGKHRVIGGPFGSKLTQADYVAEGVPVIRGRNMDLGREIAGDFVFVSHEKFAKDLAANTASSGDIIVTQRGTLGQVAIVPNSSYKRYVISQSQMAVSVDQKVADRNFVYHYLNSSLFLEYVKTSTIQTGVPHINLGILRDAPVVWPDRYQQRAIATVLSALDDKIELNRRMNKTLEASARALFRDWFVDFGPTRAKLEGRPADLAPDLWSLFPDRLGDDGVPEGWDWESLLDQANWVNGAAYKNMHFVDRHAGLPVVKIAELKAGVSGQTKFTNTDLGSRYQINDGELLFSWSGNPDTSIDAFVWTGGAAWLNQHIFAVRENGKRTKAELFVLLKWLMPQFAEIARNKQTTGLGHVTKDDMKRLQVVVASQAVQKAFAQSVAPIFDQILSNIAESRTLADTRDALLPKLMSGEFHVRDVEALAA